MRSTFSASRGGLPDRLPDRASPARIREMIISRSKSANGGNVGDWNRGRRGVEGLLVEIEVHALGVDLGEEADKMLERAAEPVHGPACHHVDLATCHGLHQRVIAGALLTAFRTADTVVGELGDDLPPEPLGNGDEFTTLVLGGLRVL